MSVEAFCKGQTVSFQSNFSDDTKNFHTGDRGTVVGHDGPLLILCMPREYRISVRKGKVKHPTRN